MHITHVITNLQTGGAEAMLLKLVTATIGECKHSVISLQTAGTIGPKLEEVGAQITQLNLAGGRIPGPGFLKLAYYLRRQKPDLIQGWMYHGNIAAWSAKAILQNKSVLLWSIRCSLNQSAPEKLLTSTVIKCSRVLSSQPTAIIYNSDRSRHQHEAQGYSRHNSVVIPNGFDVEALYPSPKLKQAMRQSLGIPGNAVVFGMLARLHPMKDHKTFLAFAAETIEKTHDTYFVAAGRDVPNLLVSNPDLGRRVGNRLILLPEQHAVAQFMNGLDVCVLNSAWGEGFPNVLGEAMACGVPCIASDVGDCAAIVGETGLVVPPRSPQNVTAAALKLLGAGADRRRELGQMARQRVIDLFSIGSVAARYKAQWMSAASSGTIPKMGN